MKKFEDTFPPQAVTAGFDNYNSVLGLNSVAVAILIYLLMLLIYILIILINYVTCKKSDRSGKIESKLKS